MIQNLKQKEVVFFLPPIWSKVGLNGKKRSSEVVSLMDCLDIHLGRGPKTLFTNCNVHESVSFGLIISSKGHRDRCNHLNFEHLSHILSSSKFQYVCPNR